MTSNIAPTVPEPHYGHPSLHVSERELHRLVARHMGWDAFKAAIKDAEVRGFPSVSALFKGRYLPAVKAWLDQENGVGGNATGSSAQDGPENFENATAGRQAGVQERTSRPTILDRQPSGARPYELPRPVHRAPARR